MAVHGQHDGVGISADNLADTGQHLEFLIPFLPLQIEVALHDMAISGQDLGALEGFAHGDHSGFPGAELLLKAGVALLFPDQTMLPEIEAVIVTVGIQPQRAVDRRT